MWDLSLQLYRALGDPSYAPTTFIGLRPEQIQWSTSCPGGFAALTAKWPVSNPDVRFSRLLSDHRAVDYGHVELYRGDVLLFEGRLIQSDFAGPRLTQIVCEGYGTSAVKDAVLQGQSLAPLSGAQLLTAALVQAPTAGFQVADVGQFVDAGSYHTLADLNNQTVAQVIDQLSKEGGNNALFDFLCYEQRRFSFLPRVCPRDSAGIGYAPNWRVMLDENISITRDLRDCYGAVIAGYTVPGSSGTQYTSPVTDPTFVSRFGFLRTTTINVGQMSLTDAQQTAATYLYQHNTAAIKAKLSYKAGDFIHTAPLGMPMQPYFARSGDWVAIGEDDSEIPPQIIVRTQCDSTAETVQIELGAAYPGSAETVSHFYDMAHHASANTAPVSGALR